MASAAHDIEASDREAAVEQREEGLTREDIFEVLSNRRRRCVLHYLRSLSDGETATLSEIASQVAAWENGVNASAVDYENRKSVQTSLYQLHLPKLADKGVVEYDQRSNTIRRTVTTGRIDLFLETVEANEVPWSVVFLGVSVLATLLSIAAWLGIFSGTVIGITGWMLLTSTVFLGTSIAFTYQYYSSNRVTSGGVPPEDFCN